MGDVVRMPLRASKETSTLYVSTWEMIIGDKTPHGRKQALKLAFNGGLMPKAKFDHICDLWGLAEI